MVPMFVLIVHLHVHGVVSIHVSDDGVDLQSVKAYLRRGTARELLGFYKEADEGHKRLPPALAFPCACGRVLSLVWMSCIMRCFISLHKSHKHHNLLSLSSFLGALLPAKVLNRNRQRWSKESSNMFQARDVFVFLDVFIDSSLQTLWEFAC